MKKIFMLLCMMFVFVFPVTTIASEMEITEEKELMNLLEQGVTTRSGESFYFSATDMQQIENELRQRNFDVDKLMTLINHIKEIKRLILEYSAGITAQTLEEFIAQFPQDAKTQVSNHLVESFEELELSIDEDGNILTRDGREIYFLNNLNGLVVKQTGLSMKTPVVVMTILLALTLISGFVSTKRSAKWS